MTEIVYKIQLREAREEIERLRAEIKQALHDNEHLRMSKDDEIERLRKLLNTGNGVIGKTLINAAKVHAETIEECEVTICDVFASTSPRDYMMNGSGGILKRMIDALHALKERQT